MNITKVTLNDVKMANSQWFASGNMEFFGDQSYQVLHDKTDVYLVRSTYAWFDMLGQPKKLVWRFNPIDKQTLKIQPLFDNVFKSLDDVIEWLKD